MDPVTGKQNPETDRTPVDTPPASLNGSTVPRTATATMRPFAEELPKLTKVLDNPSEAGLLELYQGNKEVLDAILKGKDGKGINLAQITPEQREWLTMGYFAARQETLFNQALSQANNGASIDDRYEALSKLTPEQERRFIRSYADSQNQEANQLATLPSSLQSYVKPGFSAVKEGIRDAIKQDFKYLPSFQNSTNNNQTLAEKFRITLNGTMSDFTNGNLTSLADMNDPNHKYHGYRPVTQFNAMVNISGSSYVAVPVTPDGKPATVRVYQTNDPSNITRGINVEGLATINVGNISKAFQDYNPGLTGEQFQKGIEREIAAIATNEASHSVFLASYPDIDKTDRFPLEEFNGSPAVKSASANQVWEFFSDVASASVDPIGTMRNALNPRGFESYALTKEITSSILKQSGFTDADIAELNKSKDMQSFTRTLETVCGRNGISLDELQQRYKTEMARQGTLINSHLDKNFRTIEFQ